MNHSLTHIFSSRPFSSTLLRGFLCALASELIFGFSFVFTKTALAHYHTSELLAWRFFLAFLLLTLAKITGLIRIRIPRGELLAAAALSILFPAGYYVCEAYGVVCITVCETSLIIATVPIFTAILSLIFLKEIPGRRLLSGMLFAVIGMILCIFAHGFSASFNPKGYILIFSAVLFYCSYTVLSRRLEKSSVMSITYVLIATSALFFVSWAIIRGLLNHTLVQIMTRPFRHADFLAAILYLGLMCSIFALYLCNKGLSYLGANRFSSFISLEPIISIFAGMALLGERLTLLQGIGAATTILGVYLANTTKNTSSPPRPMLHSIYHRNSILWLATRYIVSAD